MGGMSHQLIPFEGKGSGADDLSWGQRIIWGAMCHQRSSLPMGGVYPLAAGESRAGGAARPRVTGRQPRERVSWQRSPAAQGCSDGAVRYCERLLRGLPAGGFGVPAPAGPARSLWAVYESQAAHRAVLAAAARTNVSTSSVLLAAFVVALARVTGENPVLTQVLVSNRFRPGFAGSVSPVNQACLCVIDAGGVTFDE